MISSFLVKISLSSSETGSIYSFCFWFQAIQIVHTKDDLHTSEDSGQVLINPYTRICLVGSASLAAFVGKCLFISQSPCSNSINGSYLFILRLRHSSVSLLQPIDNYKYPVQSGGIHHDGIMSYILREGGGGEEARKFFIIFYWDLSGEIGLEVWLTSRIRLFGCHITKILRFYLFLLCWY